MSESVYYWNKKGLQMKQKILWYGKENPGRPDNDDMEWHIHAKKYLARLGDAEYAQQKKAHLKKGRKESTFRYSPSEYHRELISYLNENDEEAFKVRKMLSGYASAVKVNPDDRHYRGPTIDHSVLSPNGKVSGRARKAALKRESDKLFPPGFWDAPDKTPEQKRKEARKQLLQHAERLEDLANRGMHPRKYRKEAAKARSEAKALENPARKMSARKNPTLVCPNCQSAVAGAESLSAGTYGCSGCGGQITLNRETA